MANTPDEQLIRQIVEQVLARMHQPDGQSAQGGSSRAEAEHTGHAHIQPPAGVCTGDYSKFTELAGRNVGAKGAQHTPAANTQPDPGDASPLAISGIVTAQQLQEAIGAASDGIATLAPDARLTPLANDFARQHPEKIRRAERSAANSSSAANGAQPWLWWADGFCPSVQALSNKLGTRLRPSAAPRSAPGLAQVVRDLASAVKRNDIAGGLLFVQSAARAVCLANQAPVLRAIVGTCAESVQQAVNDVGANVLVVEYPYVNAAAMDAMVQHMLSRTPQAPADVQRNLNELSGG